VIAVLIIVIGFYGGFNVLVQVRNIFFHGMQIETGNNI